MILSIGMIVKNEEKYLERCLNGIKPILDNVDSELIITDTGSTDRTVEIAAKYTDKVLHFEWCNDFSAARNHGLEKAQGEWFMFLDADEIFESCDEIIHFFNSGDYKKYNSATYIIRNHAHDNVSSYSFNAQRLSKMLKGTRFTGIVHEHINTIGTPIKHLKDIADHYGYYYETEEQKQKKFRRNSELLLKRLKEDDPRDPMVYIQLYETYMMGNEKTQADKYMEEGIEYCKKNSNICLAALYCRKAYSAVYVSQYEKAIEICKQYSEHCGKRVSDKEIFAIRATAEYRLKKYKNALESLVHFFGIYNDIENNGFYSEDADIINFLASAENNYLPFVNMFLSCCIILSEHDRAVELFPELKVREHSADKDEVDNTVRMISQILEKTNDKYYDTFLMGLDAYGKKKLKENTDKKLHNKENKTVKLSIGMIVKNEEKYLERCLNGIKPILDNVDSELIITDTGSTDRTVEIAKRFTDKIIHFEWIKDFSAARNTAFQIASGEWFMFLDADEIFESCDGIIHFFNSGEYRKYKSASFVIRNLYGDKDYIDFYPRRMVRRYPDTKFVGMIHEYLYPIIPPSKHITDVALHYGYLYQTFEESKAKFERNVELMLKTLESEEDPHPKIYSQLFDGYGSVYDFDNANKYLETGIEKCREKKDSYIVILYFQKIEQLYRNGNYSDALSACEDYFSDKKSMKLPSLTTDGDIYAYMADSLFALGKCEEAIPVYKKYFETYRDIKSGKLNTEDMYQKTIEMCSDRVLTGLFNNFLGCCINTGKYNTADMYILSYPINYDEITDKALLTLCSRMIKVLETFECKNMRKYLAVLSEKGRSLFQDMLLVRLYASGTNKKLCDALCNFSDPGHKKDLDALTGFYNGSSDPAVITAASEKFVNIWNHSVELLKNGCGKDYAVDAVKCVNELAAAGREYPGNALPRPDVINAAVILNECTEKKNSGQIMDCISGLKNAVKEYGPLAPLISGYSELLVRELDKASPKTEMERLSRTIKNNIRSMISANKKEEALKLINEYKKIDPADPEIISLQAML